MRKNKNINEYIEKLPESIKDMSPPLDLLKNIAKIIGWNGTDVICVSNAPQYWDNYVIIVGDQVKETKIPEDRRHLMGNMFRLGCKALRCIGDTATEQVKKLFFCRTETD